MCSAVKSALFVFSFCSSEPLLFQVHTCAAFAQVALWMLILTNSRSMEYVVSGERERRGSSAIAFTASLSGLNKAHNCVFVFCSIPRLCWIKKKKMSCAYQKKKLVCSICVQISVHPSFTIPFSPLDFSSSAACFTKDTTSRATPSCAECAALFSVTPSDPTPALLLSLKKTRPLFP
jgi:hypothetical protein